MDLSSTTTKTTSLRILTLVAIAAVAFSCAWGKRSGADFAVRANISAEGMEFFQQSITPFTMQHCNKCHGNTQSPLFAVDPKGSASQFEKNYLLLRDRVNFSDAAESVAVQKVYAGHYACSEPCDQVGDELASLIEQWGELESNNSGFHGGGFTTGEVVIPSNVPLYDTEDPQYITMTFSLNGAGNGINGASLEIDIANFDNAFYLITRPRITGHTVNVYVNALRALVNGSARSTEQSFASLEVTISPSESVLQATGAPLMTIEDGPGLDTLSFNFEHLQEGAGACKDLALFQSTVYPIMQDNGKCYNCHGGSNGGATSKFSMIGDALTVCQRARLRIDFNNAANSLILRRPLNGFNGMPVQWPTGTADPDYATFLNWINSEVTLGR